MRNVSPGGSKGDSKTVITADLSKDPTSLEFATEGAVLFRSTSLFSTTVLIKFCFSASATYHFITIFNYPIQSFELTDDRKLKFDTEYQK